MERTHYRVTMPKSWPGAARIDYGGALFDKHCEDKNSSDCRIKVLKLTAMQADDLGRRGFKLITVSAQEPTDAPAATTAAGKAKIKAAANKVEE